MHAGVAVAFAVVAGVDHAPADQFLLYQQEDVLRNDRFVVALHVDAGGRGEPVRLLSKTGSVGGFLDRHSALGTQAVPVSDVHHFKRDFL